MPTRAVHPPYGVRGRTRNTFKTHMSTGTRDFLDDAIESLERGGSPFAIVTIDYDAKDESGMCNFSTRFADRSDCSARDLRRLRQVIMEKLLPDIEKALEKAEK